MAVRKGCCAGGCLLKTIITLVIIVVLVGGAFLWVINQTFEDLGLADYEIMNGNSLRDLGFADMQLKDVLSLIRNLVKPNVEDIVDNPYDKVEDKASADSTATSIGIPTENGEDTPNYLVLLGDEPIVTEEQMLIVFSDCELAYMMDTMIEQATENSDEDIQIIKDMNAGIEQITITKNETTTTLGIMLSIDLTPIKEQDATIKNLFNFLHVPDKIYLNSINTLSANTNGELSTESQAIEINGMSGATTTTVLNAIFNFVNQNPEEGEEPIVYFNDAIGSVFNQVIGNIGLVGTATTQNDSNVVVEGTVTYGENGITNHEITVITRIEDIE